jgi:ribonuclease P protein component
MRRRLRAVVREQLASIGAGWDLLLIARPAAAAASHGELRDTLQTLVRRAGIGE